MKEEWDSPTLAHPKFGLILASCSYDGNIIIWKEGNQTEWSQAHVFDDHRSSVNSISWITLPSGDKLYTGSKDEHVRIWDYASGQLRIPCYKIGVPTHSSKIIKMGLLQDSRLIEATSELRILAKDLDNQIIIASCGAIGPLVNLLRSSDMNTQENAVTAVLNLSISNNNKVNIIKAESIEPLIHVLQTGTPDARENAAATLYSYL
ncbi:U-box domain-containing protein 13-like [Chenopodium quinoa]|uniref:U-box domain-containing protein 13-like n=1 Tax=Chenopodium quinoa TaxID=63459 RepID=UPI000B792E44|nr:U-box domain-containing protein 13-like [Chenopodium quinoa]